MRGRADGCISKLAELDLYCSALRHGAHMGLSDAQTSALVGITRAVHQQAVAQLQPLETAFKHCGELLLTHSIERPPRSTAVFSLNDMRLLSDWFAQTYFLHYPLYQYAFTPSVTLSFTAKDPRDLILKPTPLPALDEALPEEQWTAKVAADSAEEAKALAQKQQEVRFRPLKTSLGRTDHTVQSQF